MGLFLFSNPVWQHWVDSFSWMTAILQKNNPCFDGIVQPLHFVCSGAWQANLYLLT